MDIFKKDTPATIEIVPRKELILNNLLRFDFINEMNQKTQTILSNSLGLLDNENYSVTLASFPTGKIGDKLSYTISDNVTNEVVSLGKAIILSETENIQDYSKKTNNKFYK